jgi:DinB superfamily
MDPAAAVLSRMNTQLAGLPALLESVPRTAFDRRIGGKWSVTENIAHLGRYHEVFIERLHRLLSEEAPEFDAYSAEADPEWAAWQGRSFEEVMQRLHAARDALVGVLHDVTPSNGRARRDTRATACCHFEGSSSCFSSMKGIICT